MKGISQKSTRVQGRGQFSIINYELRIWRGIFQLRITNWEIVYVNLMDLVFHSFIPERITLGSLRGLQSTINGCADKSWIKYLSESSNWGRRVDFDLRYPMYKKTISYLAEAYNYCNVALCKETKLMWDKLGMDYRRIHCNCVN